MNIIPNCLPSTHHSSEVSVSSYGTLIRARDLITSNVQQIFQRISNFFAGGIECNGRPNTQSFLTEVCQLSFFLLKTDQ